MPRSRRALLETVGTALGGALAATTGCLGRSVPRSGTSAESSEPTDSSPTTTDTAFTRWLPDPATTPLPDGYGVSYFDVAGIRERREAMHENAYTRLRRRMLPSAPTAHVDAAAVEATLEIDHAMEAAFGSFDPDAVAASLTADGAESSSTAVTRTPTTATPTPRPGPERYRGFDLYGTEYVYAVSPDAVLAVAPLFDGDALEQTKAIIDASAPDSDRYADSNDYVASMLGLVDAPDALRCYPEAMDGSTSRGFRADDITGQLKAWRFGPETAHLTFANTYVDGETADSGELREFLDADSERFAPYEGLEVSVEGRLAWVDGRAPLSAFDHLSAGGPEDGVTTPH